MKRSLRMILTCLCCVLAMGAQAQATHWSVNIYDYQYDMTAYVTLIVDDEVLTDLSDHRDGDSGRSAEVLRPSAHPQ